jgi:hypothetical protein
MQNKDALPLPLRPIQFSNQHDEALEQLYQLRKKLISSGKKNSEDRVRNLGMELVVDEKGQTYFLQEIMEIVTTVDKKTLKNPAYYPDIRFPSKQASEPAKTLADIKAMTADKREALLLYNIPLAYTLENTRKIFLSGNKDPFSASILNFQFPVCVLTHKYTLTPSLLCADGYKENYDDTAIREQVKSNYPNHGYQVIPNSTLRAVLAIAYKEYLIMQDLNAKMISTLREVELNENDSFLAWRMIKKKFKQITEKETLGHQGGGVKKKRRLEKKEKALKEDPIYQEYTNRKVYLEAGRNVIQNLADEVAGKMEGVKTVKSFANTLASRKREIKKIDAKIAKIVETTPKLRDMPKQQLRRMKKGVKITRVNLGFLNLLLFTASISALLVAVVFAAPVAILATSIVLTLASLVSFPGLLFYREPKEEIVPELFALKKEKELVSRQLEDINKQQQVHHAIVSRRIKTNTSKLLARRESEIKSTPAMTKNKDIKKNNASISQQDKLKNNIDLNASDPPLLVNSLRSSVYQLRKYHDSYLNYHEELPGFATKKLFGDHLEQWLTFGEQLIEKFKSAVNELKEEELLDSQSLWDLYRKHLKQLVDEVDKFLNDPKKKYNPKDSHAYQCYLKAYKKGLVQDLIFSKRHSFDSFRELRHHSYRPVL